MSSPQLEVGLVVLTALNAVVTSRFAAPVMSRLGTEALPTTLKIGALAITFFAFTQHILQDFVKYSRANQASSPKELAKRNLFILLMCCGFAFRTEALPTTLKIEALATIFFALYYFNWHTFQAFTDIEDNQDPSPEELAKRNLFILLNIMCYGFAFRSELIAGGRGMLKGMQGLFCSLLLSFRKRDSLP